MRDLQTWSDLNRGVKKKAEEPRKNHWYEMYELECLKTKQLQEENLKLEAKVRTLEIEQNYCLPNCSKIANLEAQIEKMKWHDLRKDPNDLPNEHKVVLNQAGMATQYDPNRGFLGFGGVGIIAWCEIPLFKEIKENEKD